MDRLLKIVAVPLTVLAVTAFIGRLFHAPYNGVLLTVSLSSLSMVIGVKGILCIYNYMKEHELNTLTQLSLLAFYFSAPACILYILFRLMFYPSHELLSLFVCVNAISLVIFIFSGQKKLVNASFLVISILAITLLLIPKSTLLYYGNGKITRRMAETEVNTRTGNEGNYTLLRIKRDIDKKYGKQMPTAGTDTVFWRNIYNDMINNDLVNERFEKFEPYRKLVDELDVCINLNEEKAYQLWIDGFYTPNR